MSVEIPWTRIASLTVRPLLFSGTQEGSLGGPDLPIARLGDRWAADLKTDRLLRDTAGRVLIARLIEGLTADGRITLEQPNIPIPSYAGPGVVVNGAGQGGTSLLIRGAQPAARIRHGQWLNVIHAGKRYLYMATANAIVGTNGRCAIPIWPMLRHLTVDGEPVVLDRPEIEGRVVGLEKGATFRRIHVEPVEFSIVERA